MTEEIFALIGVYLEIDKSTSDDEAIRKMDELLGERLEGTDHTIFKMERRSDDGGGRIL